VLGYDRVEGREKLHRGISSNPARIVNFIAKNHNLVIGLVAAEPSNRSKMLRNMTGKALMDEMALILGAWQHCRKAVLAYDWLMGQEDQFNSGFPYRVATAQQGDLYSRIDAGDVSNWPIQWGASPFKCDADFEDTGTTSGFNDFMDTFSPVAEKSFDATRWERWVQSHPTSGQS
jgi:hypothetical protein